MSGILTPSCSDLPLPTRSPTPLTLGHVRIRPFQPRTLLQTPISPIKGPRYRPSRRSPPINLLRPRCTAKCLGHRSLYTLLNAALADNPWVKHARVRGSGFYLVIGSGVGLKTLDGLVDHVWCSFFLLGAYQAGLGWCYLVRSMDQDRLALQAEPQFWKLV